MLLTLTTTHTPATDLGYLLQKHPARVQAFPLPFGQAHVFYPEAGEARCTAALLLEVDPIGLARGRRGAGGDPGLLAHYVNDRPYAASSLLSVAIARVYDSALHGRSKERPALAQAALPLQATVTAVPSRGGEALLRRLFEPLGYQVALRGGLLDERFPAWGPSPYFTVELAATCRLCDLLAHLYVLIPVLDDYKHYWVGEAEVEKLLRHAREWLPTHPEQGLIVERYLKHRADLAQLALARLADDGASGETDQAQPAALEAALEAPLRLHAQRLEAVVAELKASGAARVLDLGCGEGQLLQRLLAEPAFTEIVGLDVSYRALEAARRRLDLDRLPEAQQPRLRLLHGALTYRDARLAGYDAAALVEVIEHLDTARLAAFARVLFGHARPGTVVITTPNREYNARFPGLPAGGFRHADHRFEWDRAEFEAWAGGVAAGYGYRVRFAPVGPADPRVGAPTQMAVFQR